jgi:hypothetical protein
LAGKPNLSESLLITDGAVANLNVRRTTAIAITLGVKVLEGFLQTYNVPTGVDSAFRSAKTASFSFGNVIRRYIDPAVIGEALKNHKLDRLHLSNQGVIKGEHQLHVIDSVITSNEFSIAVEGEQNAECRIDVSLIQELLKQTRDHLTVQSTSSSMVSFVGEKRLPFAFSCVRFYLGKNGRICSLDPSQAPMILGDEAGSAQRTRRVIPSPARVLLHNDPGLFSFDEDPS